MVLDPDKQVRESVVYFFETFSRVGSAHQTVKAFRGEDLRFPSRHHNDAGKVVFRPLKDGVVETAMRTLNNPRYAGVYTPTGGDVIAARRRGRKSNAGPNPSDWIACLPNAHPGYITWDQYQENLRILESNGRGYEFARGSLPAGGLGAPARDVRSAECAGSISASNTSTKPREGRLESWYRL